MVGNSSAVGRVPVGDYHLHLRRIEQLHTLERPGQTLARAALRFALRHPAVHCVIPTAPGSGHHRATR
jgi:aryl-alcohol dehydrogenase-like predicted oxidoreductase